MPPFLANRQPKVAQLSCLALTLLMAWLGGADNSQNTVTTYHFAVAANLFNRSTNFHDPTFKSGISERCRCRIPLSLISSSVIHTDGTSSETEPET